MIEEEKTGKALIFNMIKKHCGYDNDFAPIKSGYKFYTDKHEESKNITLYFPKTFSDRGVPWRKDRIVGGAQPWILQRVKSAISLFNNFFNIEILNGTYYDINQQYVTDNMESYEATLRWADDWEYNIEGRGPEDQAYFSYSSPEDLSIAVNVFENDHDQMLLVRDKYIILSVVEFVNAFEIYTKRYITQGWDANKLQSYERRRFGGQYSYTTLFWEIVLYKMFYYGIINKSYYSNKSSDINMDNNFDLVRHPDCSAFRIKNYKLNDLILENVINCRLTNEEIFEYYFEYHIMALIKFLILQSRPEVKVRITNNVVEQQTSLFEYGFFFSSPWLDDKFDKFKHLTYNRGAVQPNNKMDISAEIKVKDLEHRYHTPDHPPLRSVASKRSVIEAMLAYMFHKDLVIPGEDS